MDLFGPVSVPSIGRKRYCLVIIDDYSRYTWVYFLRTKDETTELVKGCVTMIENKLGKRVKIMRSDNGTEFKNGVMNEFCISKGIIQQFSAPRTPEQNGVAERRNRTLIESARTMLADANLPVTFWAEAINTACYVQNRVLINKRHNKTPYEIFNNRKPYIKFFKPFGCKCFLLNTRDYLNKFQTKSLDCFFVGYSTHSKAYRVYVKDHMSVIESSDIIFNENQFNTVDGATWLFDHEKLIKSFKIYVEDFDESFYKTSAIEENVTFANFRLTPLIQTLLTQT